MPFSIDANPTEQELKELEENLESFNAGQTGIDDCHPLRLVLRDEQGATVGGLRGVTVFGWLYIGILWIDESLRGQGHGTRLLEAAESEAVARDCTDACLTTFSFQVPTFYLRHRYEEFGQLEDYLVGHVMHFLRKRLAQ